MRIGKGHTAGGQRVDVRRLDLRMPAITTEPVIQIVDRDEQDIRFVIAACKTAEDDRNKQGKNEGSHSALPCEEQIDRSKC